MTVGRNAFIDSAVIDSVGTYSDGMQREVSNMEKKEEIKKKEKKEHAEKGSSCCSTC
jgi:hypothetical protein